MSRIDSLHPDDWRSVLAHVFARVPAELRDERIETCIGLLENGALDPAGIWVARDGDAIRAVQVCVPLAGSVCQFWLPAGADDAAERSVQAGLDWARSIGCKLAQAAVHPDELSFAEPLIRRGFRRVTCMHQLTHDLLDLPEVTNTPLRFRAWTPENGPAFAATLERTYEGTLDCPELNGKRTIDEILAGHRGQARFDPAFWWLADVDDTSVGAVLLNETPDAAAWEVAYLGIVPEQRRRGFGRAMALQALHAAGAIGAARLVLAVDERNTPALRLYESLGFVESERSHVLLYFFGA